jgi:ribonuclease HI
LFEGNKPSTSRVSHKILTNLSFNPTNIKHITLRYSSIENINGYTIAFFYGATINEGSICGAGGSMKIVYDPNITWFFNSGSGTNTKAELVGVWASLFMANLLDICQLQLMGDSKVVIDWMQRKGNLLATKIEGWKRRVRTLEKKFQDLLFQHIYRESNAEADSLSKKALVSPKGSLFYCTWDGEREGPLITLKIF